MHWKTSTKTPLCVSQVFKILTQKPYTHCQQLLSSSFWQEKKLFLLMLTFTLQRAYKLNDAYVLPSSLNLLFTSFEFSGPFLLSRVKPYIFKAWRFNLWIDYFTDSSQCSPNVSSTNRNVHNKQCSPAPFVPWQTGYLHESSWLNELQRQPQTHGHSREIEFSWGRNRTEERFKFLTTAENHRNFLN